MKNIFVLLSIIVCTSCIAQDYEYKLNARTGKFDLVNTTTWLTKNNNSKFNGNRTVTRPGLPSINTGDTTLTEWLNNYFFPSTPPQTNISVSGLTAREFMVSGAALSVNLNWSVTRPAACTPLQTITVNGLPQTVNPLNEGQTQTGTVLNQLLLRNVNTNYTSTVTSQDKNASAGVTVYWYWAKYWGSFVSAVPPTNGGFTISDNQIRALTGAGVGSGFELSSSRTGTYNGINGAGNYLVFAFPSTWGVPTFVINGLINTAFTKVRDNNFINVSGANTNYQVWVSNTIQAGAIAQFQIQ